MRSIKGNAIPVAYIRLKLIGGRYFGLTYIRYINVTQKIVYTIYKVLYKIKQLSHVILKKINVKTVNKSHCSRPVTAGNMCGKQ